MRNLFQRTLELFTDKKYINHIAPISLANPHYAPAGKVLLSVNSLEVGTVEDVQLELKEIYPGVVFNFLKRYEIKEALQKQLNPIWSIIKLLVVVIT